MQLEACDLTIFGEWSWFNKLKFDTMNKGSQLNKKSGVSNEQGVRGLQGG